MNLNKKQIGMTTAWLVSAGIAQWIDTGSFLKGVIFACIIGVLSLGAIFIAEKYL